MLSLQQLIEVPASPLEKLSIGFMEEQGLTCWIKRDDQLYLTVNGSTTAFSGNKWRKLKYNLIHAKEQSITRLLSFGGAYSNHIAALAVAGLLFGFETIGFIRGEEQLPLNPTLQFAKDCGMQLVYLDRSTYRQRNSPDFQAQLQKNYGPCYLIPEGGTNELALKGTAEMANEIGNQLGYNADYYLVAAGTGGTAAGLIRGLAGKGQVLVYPILKGNFMEKEISQLVQETYDNWSIVPDAHLGGYAKTTPELRSFIMDFYQQYGIILDPIYTGKLFYHIWQQGKQHYFPRGSKLVLIHTGGLQGIAGFNQRHGYHLPMPPFAK